MAREMGGRFKREGICVYLWPTRWTWVWVNSGSWWWTGRSGVLWFLGRKESDTTEWLIWSDAFKFDVIFIWKVLSTFEVKKWSEVAQLCPTLWDPMDCSLPSSSVHGIFQARVLEWVAISFSRESSRPRGRTQVSRIVGRRFTMWATREDL